MTRPIPANATVAYGAPIQDYQRYCLDHVIGSVTKVTIQMQRTAANCGYSAEELARFNAAYRAALRRYERRCMKRRQRRRQICRGGRGR